MSCGLTRWRRAELVRGAGELGQHERAGVVEASGDVLLRDEVHAVAQRRDEHDVGREVQRDELVDRQRPVQVVDGGLSHRGARRR